MSFWDDIGGLFTGDTFYPGNPHREARANELALDCKNYFSLLTTLTDSIKNKLSAIDRQLALIYGSPSDIPDINKIDLNIHDMSFEVTQFLAPLMTATVVSEALSLGVASYLFSAGEISAEVLLGLSSLPAAFNIGIGIIAGVAAISVSIGIGAAEGTDKRDELRSTIHKGIEGRQKLAKAYLINQRLEQSISVMLCALSAMTTAVPIQVAVDSLKRAVDTARAEIDTITDENAKNMLSNLDASRNSWTNEDALPNLEPSPRPVWA